MNTNDEGNEITARGWPSSWLVGYLAALGAASRTGATLRFTRSAQPVAVLGFDRNIDDPVEHLAEALTSVEDLEMSIISRTGLDGVEEFPRKPTLAQYRERGRLARSGGDRLLGATITDLTADVAELAHSPFDAAVPKGITLWQRAVACRELVPDEVSDAMRRSLDGLADRMPTNGLGFDSRRITVSTAPNAGKQVDVIAELFAFEALPLFPARGDGGQSAVVRGWGGGQTRRHAFTWPVWSDPMPVETIDALLDQFWNRRPTNLTSRRSADDATRASLIERWARQVEPYGIFAAYGSVPYLATGSADTTRGFSSEQLWNRP